MRNVIALFYFVGSENPCIYSVPNRKQAYDFEESEQKLNLSLHTRVSTDSEGIAKCLGLNAESKVELQDLIRILEPKLIDANRLKIGITG